MGDNGSLLVMENNRHIADFSFCRRLPVIGFHRLFRLFFANVRRSAESLHPIDLNISWEFFRQKADYWLKGIKSIFIYPS
jgi:hypothetical protein